MKSSSVYLLATIVFFFLSLMDVGLLTSIVEIRPDLVCAGSMAFVVVNVLVSWVIAQKLADSLSPVQKVKVPDKRKREQRIVASLEQKLKHM